MKRRKSHNCIDEKEEDEFGQGPHRPNIACVTKRYRIHGSPPTKAINYLHGK